MKKKYICSLLGGMTAFFAMPVVSASAVEVNPVLANTEIQTEQGQEFTTTIYLPENSNVIAFEAILDYDSSSVSLVSSKAYDGVEVNEKNKEIIIAYSAETNQNDKINVVDLTFRVDDELAAGSYDVISLKNASASSEDENGTAKNYDLTANFNKLSIYGYGDANLNGRIEAIDVTLVKQHIVKIKELKDLSKKYANAFMDFEEDGITPKISSKDAGLILQKVVDKEGIVLGNRVNVTFYDNEGEVYSEKSVKAESELKNIPETPDIIGLENIRWSLNPEKYVEVDFSKITSDIDVYCIGDKDKNRELYNNVVTALEEVFPQSEKMIDDTFELPYKNKYGTNNMPTAAIYDNVDVTWTIDSGTLSKSLNTINYVFSNPNLDYTTWVTFKANIYIDGKPYGSKEFKREIKGKIDMPDSSKFDEIINQIPIALPEHYRLPGYVSLENKRIGSDVEKVQNVDIQWSIVKNTDGKTADSRVLDAATNEIIYLKDETELTLQYDFIFEGHSIYNDRIERTIPAKSIEGQIEYAQEYIKCFVPSVISGETYFPTTVPLYDLTISWIPDIESGKVVIGENKTVNGTTYKVIDIGEKAGYMEWAKVSSKIERNGDESFKSTGVEFDVQLAGNGTIIPPEKISDINLYNELCNIFDKQYGNANNELTEEEIYSTETMEKLGYKLDLSNKGIKCLSGIKYLKNYKKLDLSNNDLSGTNASLGELASLNHLEQLSLSNCGISEIPPSVFASKYIIEGIDLSYNRLKDVNFLTLVDSRTQTEQPFTELKELFLQGNYISDISNLSFVNDSDEVVSRIPNVNVLTLSRDLSYFEYTTDEKLDKVFKNVDDYEYDITTSMDITPIGLMESLTTLWLGNNFIEDITPVANCKLLTTLDLSGNCITATSTSDGLEPLSKLQSLVCLKLDGNNIHTVKSLNRLIYLEILSLSNNSISSVSNALSSIKNLVYLDLDGNELTSFDAAPFTKLNRLFLENQSRYNTESKEYTKTLEQVLNLEKAANIVELRLNNNNLDAASVMSIGNLTGLEYLSLSGNTVEDLSFLKDLTLLRHLELARCNINQTIEVAHKNTTTGETSVEKIDNLSYLSDKKNLTILDLSDNGRIDINETTEDIIEATEATVIEATEADISGAIESEIREISDAESVSETTEAAVSETTEAAASETTEANDNDNTETNDNNSGITDISALSELTNLGVFYIDNVKLDSADAVKRMTKLQYLSMQNSGLTNAGFITTLKSLEYLNLSGHNFASFDFDFLSGCDNLEGLFLDSTTNTEGVNISGYTDNQNLKYLSLANINLGSMDKLPHLDNIVYLGLRNTNIRDFNGTYSEADGYINSINRYRTLRYLDVAENPELFTAKNLETLYDFVSKPEQKIAIILYREDAPEGYIPGLMDANLEAKKLKNDIDFGEGGTDISEALKAGYVLQSELNGYEIEWDIKENIYYYVEDGKLFFTEEYDDFEKIDQQKKINFEIYIKNLYYREDDSNSQPKTPVSFNASIQAKYETVPNGEKIFERRETAVSTEDTMEGWILDPTLTEEGYSEWGEWSDWTEVKINSSDLLEVQTDIKTVFDNWGEWSEWSTEEVTANNNTEVESRQEPHTSEKINYFPAHAIVNKSLVDTLKAIGADSSNSNRARIAVVNGLIEKVEDYAKSGNYDTNVAMANLLAEGKLIDTIETKTEYTVYYRYRERQPELIDIYRYRERTKAPTIYHFYRDVYSEVLHAVIVGMTLVVEE